MRFSRTGWLVLGWCLIGSLVLAAQAVPPPAPPPQTGGRGSVGPRPNTGPADRPIIEPAALERGTKIYAVECVTCHGASARGTERGPSLIRSPLVLRDRQGSRPRPVLREGPSHAERAAVFGVDDGAGRRSHAVHPAEVSRHPARIAALHGAGTSSSATRRRARRTSTARGNARRVTRSRATWPASASASPASSICSSACCFRCAAAAPTRRDRS